MKASGFDRLSFAKSVKDIVREIPEGMVLTYGDVAALAGSPSHSRLVGRILSMIGMESEIPCHRVVNVEGRPAPHWPSQGTLLRMEGVKFNKWGRVVMSEHRWVP